MANATTSKERGAAGAPVKSSHIIEEYIDIGVGRDVAYAQWTEYDAFSQYTKKESARQQREDRVTFTSKIGPSRRKWDTQIVEQEPGRRIAWRSVGGPQTIGVVTFHSLDEHLTRLMIDMEYHPSGLFETVGNFLRMQRRRVRKDLKLFKAFIELRGEATGKGAADEVDAGGGLKPDVDDRLSDEGGRGDRGSRRNGASGRTRTGAGRGNGRSRSSSTAGRRTSSSGKGR